MRTEGHVRTRGEVAICKPRREVSERSSPANTLILGFWPPECTVRNNFFK